ncbi:zinc finger protein 687 isoform X1 [Varanus komodoensis]|uniref:zinc finger protein 687 isoform X1 n=1 Tax=Varanus komodoensis TaxID=61221 RepID=UPI001CF781EA|nr:zinc finger protein 687 isoform X1 [Varanus komodoensis]XP_044305248.1 zinc finger protein 687 isoform X1 [Varanus komodoensis]XP_044305249.1 zinc finger protein 687 isoform X1 [Varanus komodoensis]
MGDMKTPDFDDLLAAFDIPDIDTNEAIHSGHEEAEAHIKPIPVENVVPEHALPHADITTVSVIVKNTVCPEQLDVVDGRVKDSHGIGARLLQNGFAAPEVPHASPGHPADVAAPANGECWPPKEKGTKSLDLFSHFSPDPHEDGEACLIDQPRESKPKEKSLPVPSLSPPPVLASVPPLDCRESSGARPPAFPQAFDACPVGGAGLPLTPPPPPSPPAPLVIKQESDCEVPCRGAGPVGPPKPGSVCYSTDDSPVTPWPASEASLDGGPSGAPDVKCSPASPPEQLLKSPPLVKASPGPALSPKHPSGAVLKEEPVEKPLLCPPGALGKEEEKWEEDENDDEATGSPSSSSSRPLKVRIKTIKTSSGSITRTVTRVSSDSEPGAAKPPLEHNAQEAGAAAGDAPLPAVTEKEEAAAEPPSPRAVATSPRKVLEGPKVVSVQLGDGTRITGTVLPASTIQNASSAMLMAASVAQQKAVVLPGKAVAKNIISLVPQALPKAGEARATSGPAAQPGPGAVANQKVNGTTVVVMQPQKSLPAVAGTVISRSQSSLVEAFNRILNSKNLLPTYKPNLLPPADSSLALPPLGYRCLECGDAFALEKSLARHYDRRSMRIEVTCNHCTKRLVFFNKCSLLLHAREHKDKGLVMQCSHLVMRPIALDQMVGQPDVAPLVSVASPGAGRAAGVAQEAVALAGGAGGAPQEPPVLPLSGAAPEPASTNSCQCLECKEQCRDKAGLAAHFQQSSASTVCSVCPMIMPNRCSFGAHQRMHKNRPPHVCPECGGNFLWPSFEAHLKEACLHFSRRIGYRCPSCSVVFGGVNSIKSHIQTSHCEVFHKCPICPMAFKSAPSAHGHIYTQHPGFSNQQSKMIYKCAMCDTVFTHKPLLSSHFDQHLLNQRVSVFKCPDCPLLFAQKRTMLEHLKNTHQPQKPKEDPVKKPPATPLTPKQEPAEEEPPPAAPKLSDPSSSSSEDEDPPSSPEVRKSKRGGFRRKAEAGGRSRSNGWTCGICHSWFPERDEYVVHMKRIHGKCVKKFPCRLCERSFCSAPSLRRHVRVNHEGIKRVYPCRYCTEGKRTFSSRLILEKHIQVRHGIKVTDETRSQEVLITRMGSRNSQASSRKHKLSSDEGDSCSEEPDSSTPPSKTHKGDRKSPHHCHKCGYVASSAADFQEHIPQHRTGASAHQCRECGLCFTSQVSLSRHRFITHKKRRGAGEAEDGGSRGNPEGGSPSAAEGKLSCTVCGKGFDTQLNLKTHFRTHGMAFIKARQNVGAEN